jgi:hypothetical protein
MISVSHMAERDQLRPLCVQTMLRIAGIGIPISAACCHFGFSVSLRSVHGEPTEAIDVTAGEDRNE